MLTLFDDLTRTRQSPAEQAEPAFPFLNESAWQDCFRIRSALEKCFSSYPMAFASGLRNRFRSMLDGQHEGAFFELILHELLIKLGCEVQIPGSSVGDPDFLVIDPRGIEFHLEAKVIHPESAFDVPRLEGKVIDAINQVYSPDFFVSAEIHGAVKTAPKIRRLQAEISDWLDSLDYETLKTVDIAKNHADRPLFRHRDESWVLCLRAFSWSEAARGKPHRLIGLGPFRGGIVDPVPALLRGLKSKSGKYRDAGVPLVLALNELDRSRPGRHDAVTALVGKQLTDNGRLVDYPEPRTQPFWGRQKNRRFTNVILFDSMTPWGISKCSPMNYVNPWLRYPKVELLEFFPTATFVEDGVEWESGNTVGPLLDLTEDWPTLEPRS